MAKELTRLAKNLRQRSTDVERLLWSHIRAGRFEGMKFRRQHPIGQYIVDFVCPERKMVIELDGGHHAFRTKLPGTGNGISGLKRKAALLCVFGIMRF